MARATKKELVETIMYLRSLKTETLIALSVDTTSNWIEEICKEILNTRK